MKRRNINELNKETGCLANFVRTRRKQLGYNQNELSIRTGVGLRFLKELELGKKTLRMDKVEQVLNFFGHTLEPIPMKKNLVEGEI